MTEERYNELVLVKLDKLTDNLKDLRNECHGTFARQSDLVQLSSTLAKLDLKVEGLEKAQAALMGARSVEVGAIKWLLGILATVAAALIAAYFMSK